MKYYAQVTQDGDIIGTMADDTGRLDPKIWKEIPSQIYGFRDRYGSPMLKLVNGEIVKKQGYNEAKWDNLRNTRNYLLSETDWTQLADAPLTAAEKTAWKAYRNELRDLPDTYPDPDTIIWPTKPG